MNSTMTEPAEPAYERAPKRISPDSPLSVAANKNGVVFTLKSDWQPDTIDINIDEVVALSETLLSESGQRRSTDMDPVIAVDQLCKSDRGRKAALAFLKMLGDGGDGLDNDNWRALEALCRFAYTEDRGAYRLYDVLPSRKGGV